MIQDQPTWPWRERCDKEENDHSKAWNQSYRGLLWVRTPGCKWQKPDSNQSNHSHQERGKEVKWLSWADYIAHQYQFKLVGWREFQNVFRGLNLLWKVLNLKWGEGMNGFLAHDVEDNRHDTKAWDLSGSRG